MAEDIYGLPVIEPDYNELEQQLDLYEKGRRLRTLTNNHDWELVVGILKDYKERAENDLTNLPPGDPNVMQSHAAASATKQVYQKFLQDIDAAVGFANNPPQAVVESLHGIIKAADVKAAMEM